MALVSNETKSKIHIWIRDHGYKIRKKKEEEDPGKIPGFGNSIHDSGSKGCFSRKNLAFYSMLVAK